MNESELTAPTTAQKKALALIAGGQLLALSLWFSASAVAPQLTDEWRLSDGEQAGLTLAVQLGFVAGALLIAIFSIGDVVPSRRLFVVSAMAGAIINIGLLAVTADSVAIGLGLRFATGIALAGVYPAGLKVMSGWFRHGRGMALGVLVGALTIGSASPHLVGGLGLDWRGVVVASTGLAVISSLLMTKVMDGPFEVPTQPFRWNHARRVIRNRGVRLSTYGYLGHMWELYAMWTWMAAFLLSSSDAASRPYPSVSILTFLVIGIGGLGSWLAGVMSDRLGRTKIAGGAMAISGTCAVVSPLLFGGPLWLIMPVMLIWGVTVVADSAQFSTMVTETAESEVRGTALTLQTAAGFLLTLVTIRLVPALAGDWGWQWAFPVLAVGPMAGIVAMVRLARGPEAAVLAGGRG